MRPMTAQTQHNHPRLFRLEHPKSQSIRPKMDGCCDKMPWMTGKPEVIDSSVGLVPINASALPDARLAKEETGARSSLRVR